MRVYMYVLGDGPHSREGYGGVIRAVNYPFPPLLSHGMKPQEEKLGRSSSEIDLERSGSASSDLSDDGEENDLFDVVSHDCCWVWLQIRSCSSVLVPRADCVPLTLVSCSLCQRVAVVEVERKSPAVAPSFHSPFAFRCLFPLSLCACSASVFFW